MHPDIYYEYEPTEQDLQDWAVHLEAQDREEKEERTRALRSHPAYIYGGREAWTGEEREAFVGFANCYQNPVTGYFSLPMDRIASYFRQELAAWRAV